MEKELAGSIAAAMYSFGRRSLNLVSQGKPLMMIIQGELGVLCISMINATMVFFGVAAERPDLAKMLEEINNLKVGLFSYV